MKIKNFIWQRVLKVWFLLCKVLSSILSSSRTSATECSLVPVVWNLVNSSSAFTFPTAFKNFKPQSVIPQTSLLRNRSHPLVSSQKMASPSPIIMPYHGNFGFQVISQISQSWFFWPPQRTICKRKAPITCWCGNVLEITD